MQIVFTHGAFVRDGAWWWQRVGDLVEQRTGVTSRAVLLPSCGEGGASGAPAGLVDDAAALRAVLDEVAAQGDEALVVGHSYGGTVMAEGADHPATRHLLYISSYLPDVGQSQADLTGGEPDALPVRDAGDGRLAVGMDDAEAFGERFWADVPDPDARAAAWARLTPQSVAALGSPTSVAAWQGRDSTYLVCAADRSTSPDLQRFHAARATRSVELPTSHHPMLSRPELVVVEVERVLTGL